HLAMWINTEVEDFVGTVGMRGTARHQGRRDARQCGQRDAAAVHADAKCVGWIAGAATANAADSYLAAVHGIAEADAERWSHNQLQSIPAVVVATVPGADHGFLIPKNRLQERR